MHGEIMTKERLEKLTGEAEAGDAQAAYEVAEYHYGRREFEEAFAWYIKTAGCEHPNPMVYFNIGYAYQNGEGTGTDLVSAFDFYEKAAAFRLPQALYNLAWFYQNGLVVKQDFSRAREYSGQAAKELASLQRQILSVVHKYVKLGGTLVYSTCTLHDEENEKNAEWFVKTFPEFTLVSQEQIFPRAGQGDGFFLGKFVRDGAGR